MACHVQLRNFVFSYRCAGGHCVLGHTVSLRDIFPQILFRLLCRLCSVLLQLLCAAIDVSRCLRFVLHLRGRRLRILHQFQSCFQLQLVVQVFLGSWHVANLHDAHAHGGYDKHLREDYQKRSRLTKLEFVEFVAVATLRARPKKSMTRKHEWHDQRPNGHLKWCFHFACRLSVGRGWMLRPYDQSINLSKFNCIDNGWIKKNLTSLPFACLENARKALCICFIFRWKDGATLKGVSSWL